MPRTNKKSRIKGIPARIQLQQKDAATGSFPTNVRVASDNRTGNYGFPYDDMKTIAFGEYDSFPEFDILVNSIVSYWRFNSGSQFDEVTQTSSGPPSASYTIKPTYVTASTDRNDSSVFFEMTVKDPPSFSTIPHFEADTAKKPFSGPRDDPNATSLALFAKDFSGFSDETQLTGSLSIFNPGEASPSPGGTEDAFSISFWLDPFNEPTVADETVIAIATDTATSGGSGFTNYALAVQMKAKDRPGIMILDSSGNGIGIVSDNAVAGDTSNIWYHFVFTYDGSKSQNGIKIYLSGVLQTNTSSFTQGTPASYVGLATDTSTDKVFLGRVANDDNSDYEGRIDELAFFNKALSEEEVAIVYNTHSSIHLITGSNRGVYYGTNINVGSPFVKDLSEETTNLSGSGFVIKGIGDSIAKFTPGQDLEPFKEIDLPALDGLSSTSSFYAIGSSAAQVGEGFDQPLWSKTKIEIDLPVITSGSTINTIPVVVSGGSATTTDADPATGPVQKTFGGPSTGTGLVGLSYPMAYYNFDNYIWEGVGRGEALCYTATYTLDDGNPGDALHYKTECIGFTHGLLTQREGIRSTGISGAFEYMAGAAQPTSNFGFPFSARYHATSSQLLPMSNFISEPFVVEKIVVDFSGAFAFDSENFTTSTITPSVTNILSSALPACISNFFILNQKKPFSFSNSVDTFNDVDGSNDPFALVSNLPTRMTLSNGGTPISVNTVREMITFAGISSFAANLPEETFREGNVGANLLLSAGAATKNVKELLTRDFSFESEQNMTDNLATLDWSGSLRLEIGSRNPTRVSGAFGIYGQGNAPRICSTDTKFDFGGRNGLGITFPSGRDLVSPIVGINVESTALNGRTFVEAILADSSQHFRFGGYILKPEDNLIFGWQQPLPMDITVDYVNRHVNDGPFSSMTFKGAKITLYGSLLREGKEFHDTLNQLLTSDAVHEVIE
jgi:hypothetical protein